MEFQAERKRTLPTWARVISIAVLAATVTAFAAIPAHLNEPAAAACEPTRNPAAKNIPGSNANAKARMNTVKPGTGAIATEIPLNDAAKVYPGDFERAQSVTATCDVPPPPK